MSTESMYTRPGPEGGTSTTRFGALFHAGMFGSLKNPVCLQREPEVRSGAQWEMQYRSLKVAGLASVWPSPMARRLSSYAEDGKPGCPPDP
jgi:hypothetical protein